VSGAGVDGQAMQGDEATPGGLQQTVDDVEGGKGLKRKKSNYETDDFDIDDYVTSTDDSADGGDRDKVNTIKNSARDIIKLALLWRNSSPDCICNHISETIDVLICNFACNDKV
jgi:hypothetical protein